MTLGALSEDQARYADRLAQATGLDSRVVTAWVGAESGWGTYKAGHNYLNIGPGRQYTSTAQAAAAASQLVTAAPQYAGIRAAIPQGGGAQVAAIGQSPWGTSAGLLSQVWSDLTKQPASSSTSSGTPDAVSAGFTVGPVTIPSPFDLLGGAGDKVVGAAISGALSVVFVAGALGLVALGLARLTGNNPKEMFGKAQSGVGAATQAATLAAI